MAASPGVRLSHAMSLPPKDAISYFESKGLRLSGDWHEIWGRAQAHAFTVANVAKLDVLQDIHEAVGEALREGKTGKWFEDTLTPRLQAKGWWGKRLDKDARGKDVVVRQGSPARLRLIYGQNLQTAYMAGRYREMLSNTDERPWWTYVALLDAATRPTHAALNGLTFRFDDPFWASHYPPNGWGCRCRVRARSDHALERDRVTPESSEGRLTTRQVQTTDRRTGEVVTREVSGYRLPSGLVCETDLGFSYNPGQAAFGADMEAARKLALVPDVELRSQAIQALNGNPERRRAWEGFASGVLDSRRGGVGQVQVVHFMRSEVAQAVRELGAEPAQVVTLSAKRLLHADSAQHVAAGTAPGREALLRLPALMNEAVAVLWDEAHANLIYVCPVGKSGKVLKVVVDAPMRPKDAKGLKRLGRFDAVINAMEVVEADMRPVGGSQYRVIWKKD